MSQNEVRFCRLLAPLAILFGTIAIGGLAIPEAAADVAVISNRCDDPVTFAVAQQGQAQKTIELAPGNVFSFFFDDSSAILFHDGNRYQQIALGTQQVYFFGRNKGQLFFQNMPLTSAGFGEISLSNTADDSLSNRNRNSFSGSKKPGFSSLGFYFKDLPNGSDDGCLEIPVKIFVDDNEPSQPRFWEARLRRRFDKVNQIYEKLCRLRFKIVAVDTWYSDNSIDDFALALKEFELVATPQPGEISIGFTSQFGMDFGQKHLGMTRQPFHTHILIREFAPQFTENERVEALTHELGHWLGAVHNPDPHCYMQPVLGDRKSRQTNFIKTFNPINVLLMNLWTDCRAHKQNGHMFMPDKRLEDLIVIYRFMAQIPRTDSNAQLLADLLTNVAQQERERRQKIRQAIQVVRAESESTADKSEELKPIPPEVGVPEDLEKLAESMPQPEQGAESNSYPAPDWSQQKMPQDVANDISRDVAGADFGDLTLPDKPKQSTLKGAKERVSTMDSENKTADGDTETDVPDQSAALIMPTPTMNVNESVQYVLSGMLKTASAVRSSHQDGEFVNELIKSAARSAIDLPEKHRVRAFLVAVGLSMDSSGMLKKVPLVGERVALMDTKELARQRAELIGQPSLMERPDWSQHFGVSTGLSGLLSPEAGRQAGLIKELADNKVGGSGFDCGDLAADLAGCLLAEKLLKGDWTLQAIAFEFDVLGMIPSLKGYSPNLDNPDQVLKDVQKKVEDATENRLRKRKG